MDPAIWAAVGVPSAVLVLSAVATWAGPLGKYLSARTHNALLERIGNGAGRIAARVADQLKAQPAGVDLASTRDMLVKSAAAELFGKFGTSIVAVGGDKAAAQQFVVDELAKVSGVNAVGKDVLGVVGTVMQGAQIAESVAAAVDTVAAKAQSLADNITVLTGQPPNVGSAVKPPAPIQVAVVGAPAT